jgi:BTB/POZ domain-containing protein 7
MLTVIISLGAEDIIIQELSPMSLLTTLEWSDRSHGSHWVYRQTMHYLREEFLNIVHLDVYLNLPKRFVIEALKSDFLQVLGEIYQFKYFVQ